MRCHEKLLALSFPCKVTEDAIAASTECALLAWDSGHIFNEKKNERNAVENHPEEREWPKLLGTCQCNHHRNSTEEKRKKYDQDAENKTCCLFTRSPKESSQPQE